MANAVSGESPRRGSSAFQAIFWGGVIVGILDLAYAIVVYSPRDPILIPQTIASGLLGWKSYHEGVPSAVLGVALHFVIAFGAATVYYLASRKLTFLTRRAVIFGMLYGAAVYLFMHLVVLPLSAVTRFHVSLIYPVAEFVEHWFFVGLPIALSVRRFAS
jgi:uncharacterized membrane protein YagU involved in acid resistance